MAYTTTAKIKEYLGIPSDVTTDDTLIGDILTRATTIINSETGQSFEPVTLTKEYFRSSIDFNHYPYYLELDEYLQTVTALTNGNGEVIPSNGFILLPKNRNAYTKILLKSDYSWEFDDLYESTISIVGTWGLFSTVPADVTHFTIRLVSFLYKQKDNHQDLDRTIIAGDSTILPQSLPSDMYNFFRRYRKVF